MKRRLIYTATLLLLFGTFISNLALPCFANSAQSYWEGTDSRGCVIIGENCPIEVTSEVLTFDIAELYKTRYDSDEEFLAYSGRVTAEYTFYNPSDLTVTAKLAFPFGGYSYDHQSNSAIPDTTVDAEKYDITVNGEAVDKGIRHTLDASQQFNITEDLLKLSDEYLKDDFFYPDMTVTRYDYTVSGIDSKNYRTCYAAFDWDTGDGSTRLYIPGGSSKEKNRGGIRINTGVQNGDEITVYAIGTPLSETPKFKLYESFNVKDNETISGTVSLTSKSAMTFEALALTNYSEETNISKVDWYNAVLCSFNNYRASAKENNFIFTYVTPLYGIQEFISNLMRWYEYEITLAPGESIVNTVTAPLYPAIDKSYTPTVYDYTYLLSPASTWASFRNLQIIINTPYYITDSSLDGFLKTDAGYSATFETLPEGELEFTLCTAKDPEPPKKTIYDYVSGQTLRVIYLSVAGAVVLGVLFLIIKKTRR